MPRGAPLPPRLYALDNHPTGGGYRLSVIDPSTDRVIANVAVGAKPHHIYLVPHTDEAYITHFAGCRLQVLDLVTNELTGDVGTGAGPRHLAFSADGSRAFVVDYQADSLAIIDTATNRTAAIVPTGARPNFAAPTPDGRLVFVADSGADTVTVVNAATAQVVATVGVGRHPFNLAVTPDGRQVVVANAGSDTVSFIAVGSLRVSATVPLGGRLDKTIEQKLNVSLSPDGRYAFVGNQAGSAFDVFDVDRHVEVARIPAGLGADFAYPVKAGPAAGLALGTARYSSVIDVLAMSPPRLIRQLSSPPGSHGAEVSRDWSTAYVTDRIGNAVSVIDLRSLRVVANIHVGRFPDGILYVWFMNGMAQEHHF